MLVSRGHRVLVALGMAAVIGALAMGFWRFWQGKKRSAWDLATVEPPWGAGPSIHDHIRKHIASGSRGLTAGGERLPDEKDDGRPKWVAGGADGAFGHHGSPGSRTDRAKLIHRALAVVLDDASPLKVKKLYEQLLDSAADVIDPLLRRIVEEQDLDPRRLEELALWLATRSPDREPVKVAIGILGIIPGADHSDLFLMLGRHEELTLYAAVALTNSEGKDAEAKLFELARHVDGWGRIHIVEQLATTSDPAIQAWMLREGYKNVVMYAYLAYTCATAGGLRAALEKEAVDPELLAGAGDIIVALLTGGPAQDIDDYADGAVVVARYLHHLGDEPKTLEQLLVVSAIARFLDEKADWKAREERGFAPALREALRAKVLAVKRLPHWKPLLEAGLASRDGNIFARADAAAKALGIDTWEHHFARLGPGEPYAWQSVMTTTDPARIDRVIALAETALPLEAIASGPARELGLGPEWTDHLRLEFVLHGLVGSPGKGWRLIRTGLRSPIVRMRHAALRALSPWGKDKWPPGAEELLHQAAQVEPDDGVRAGIHALLAGKPLAQPRLEVDEP